MGLAVGLSRLALEFVYPMPRCGILDRRPSLVKDIHYLHFALFLCLLTAAVAVVISWLTRDPAETQVSEETWSESNKQLIEWLRTAFLRIPRPQLSVAAAGTFSGAHHLRQQGMKAFFGTCHVASVVSPDCERATSQQYNKK